jgi:GTP-binding protein EngB required for normal cell division
MRPLTEAKAGDKVAIMGYTREGRSTITEAIVTRVNLRSISAAGKRWDLKTCRQVGDPGYGYSTTLELWDEDIHPHLNDASKAKELLNILNNTKRTPKQWAALLPALRAVVLREE